MWAKKFEQKLLWGATQNHWTGCSWRGNCLYRRADRLFILKMFHSPVTQLRQMECTATWCKICDEFSVIRHYRGRSLANRASILFHFLVVVPLKVAIYIPYPLHLKTIYEYNGCGVWKISRQKSEEGKSGPLVLPALGWRNLPQDRWIYGSMGIIENACWRKRNCPRKLYIARNGHHR